MWHLPSARANDSLNPDPNDFNLVGDSEFFLNLDKMVAKKFVIIDSPKNRNFDNWCDSYEDTTVVEERFFREAIVEQYALWRIATPVFFDKPTKFWLDLGLIESPYAQALRAQNERLSVETLIDGDIDEVSPNCYDYISWPLHWASVGDDFDPVFFDGLIESLAPGGKILWSHPQFHAWDIDNVSDYFNNLDKKQFMLSYYEVERHSGKSVFPLFDVMVIQKK